jgi:hypothetical protein
MNTFPCSPENLLFSPHSLTFLHSTWAALALPIFLVGVEFGEMRTACSGISIA